jgi:UDP-glucose:(heptosyl)LPS alpha-1,3-glucosyltransferase
MLNPQCLHQWSEQALSYAATEDLYSMPDKAAQIIRDMAEKKAEINRD